MYVFLNCQLVQEIVLELTQVFCCFSIFFLYEGQIFRKKLNTYLNIFQFSTQIRLYFQIPRPTDMHELQRQQFLLRSWLILRGDIRSIPTNQTIFGRAPAGIRYIRLPTFLQFFQR